MASDQDLDAPEIDMPRNRSRGGNAGKLILAVVVITLVAILLVPGQDQEDRPAPLPPAERPSLLEPEPASGQDGATRDRTAPETATPGTPAPDTVSPQVPSGDDAPGAAARRLIDALRSQARPDLERAWQEARRFEQTDRLDDALLLYYFAAREGHGPSAMALGRAADPASFREGGLFQAPDELQARKWYRKAERAGVAEAGTALEALRARIERAATAGDARARRLMLLWK